MRILSKEQTGREPVRPPIIIPYDPEFQRYMVSMPDWREYGPNGPRFGETPPWAVGLRPLTGSLGPLGMARGATWRGTERMICQS